MIQKDGNTLILVEDIVNDALFLEGYCDNRG